MKLWGVCLTNNDVNAEKHGHLAERCLKFTYLSNTRYIYDSSPHNIPQNSNLL